MCAGFKHGTGDGHHIQNPTLQDALYLEIGDRSAADEVFYPDDDLKAAHDELGRWFFTHKDVPPTCRPDLHATRFQQL